MRGREKRGREEDERERREEEREESERAVYVQREKRPRTRSAVSFRCIIFSFATSRIHKNTFNSDTTVACPCIMRISYLKSILRGAWLLGAQGNRLPLPNG